MVKISLLDIVQDLCMAIEKLFKLHLSRLALEAKPVNDLFIKVSALGSSFEGDCLIGKARGGMANWEGRIGLK